ncbi:MAG: hypothetical protein ABII25_02495 [bacterium]
MKKIYFLLIIFIFAACAKQKVDTKKEAANVREMVSKISGDKINKSRGTKIIKTMKDTEESDLLFSETSDFVYPYKNSRDPFYSFVVERKKMNAELGEKEKKEEKDKKKAELGINIVQEEWGKVEISAILGDGKGYLVLFGGDDTIYRKNDYIDKDKKIKIVGADKGSVNLTMIKNGKFLNKQIVMKKDYTDRR